MYKLISGSDTVLRLADGAYIPADPGNRARQDYDNWLSQGNTPEPVDVESLSDQKLRVVREIDSDVDAIYAAAIGNRGPEYVDAEAQAATYIDGGYTGDVPPMVACWATAKAWTAAQAADDIMAAAASLNGAKQAIRAARLLRKEQVRSAADQAELSAVMAQWAGFVAAVRGQLGL